MKLILLGAPGAGKGTQAKLICKNFQIPHISTGDMFRTHIQKRTSLGIQVENYINNGELVPDKITIAIVKERLLMKDCSSGFLLDGFPRNLKQAKELDLLLQHTYSQPIDGALLIDLPSTIIVDRLSGRRFCTKCGSSFHITLNPSKFETKCENCGEMLIQRSDDKKEIVLDRLKTYYKTIKPLINYYHTHGILYTIQGSDSIYDIFNRICTALKSHCNMA